MKNLRLLDLFCGAGGSAVGYHRAGFEDITGVDIKPQSGYPFKFHQVEAIKYLYHFGSLYDFIHASPPCQEYTKAAKQWRKEGREYQDLIEQVRDMLRDTGKPYVIESVPGAPLINPVILNGAMFGLNVHRTRLFECSFEIPFFLLPQGKKPVKMGRPVKAGDVVQPVGHFSGVAYAGEQMGIDWMNQGELAQAIPPAYTEFIGLRIMEVLDAA